ncbi:TlyA family RNA methyltransferase [Parvularcula lutaonensis]|uniref:TlyA family RNA methyltransferase n=1 Tax=Parvularcula lutaonensis TaxID=491923 RepID=A0ABV7MBW7_9PROT|nr:TlyA family RNA methyltransferase [Parvularcula lutaonensis]GGY39756.1 hemolysin [Parvularcula lutaonensis]
MRLDQALVEKGLAPSRARAQDMIRAGHILVDGAASTKPAAKVATGARLEVKGEAHDYVSRAALKLVGGLDTFAIDPAGKTCLDLGSSTGGFTDVLLRRGAAKVFAVDVGTDQLHGTLRRDPRVVSLENTHAKALSRDLVADPVDLFVCDVSFISIRKALPPALCLASPAAELCTLVKPQFELGREAIGKNGRVLTPPEEQEAYIRREIVPFLGNLGWPVHALAVSPIAGGEGTLEFLLHATKTPT